MAIPKKNTQGLDNDAENENPDSRTKLSSYEEDSEDFDSLQMDDLDTFENDYDEDDE